jgi:hypothetical protein
MKPQWSGGPEIFLYEDPNGIYLAQVAESSGPARWDAFDLTGDVPTGSASAGRIGEYQTLMEAKAAVEAHYSKPFGKRTAGHANS